MCPAEFALVPPGVGGLAQIDGPYQQRAVLDGGVVARQRQGGRPVSHRAGVREMAAVARAVEGVALDSDDAAEVRADHGEHGVRAADVTHDRREPLTVTGVSWPAGKVLSAPTLTACPRAPATEAGGLR